MEDFSHLGMGIRFPLRRVGGDFEFSSGQDLVFSSIIYILMTRSDGPGFQGEQPWDTGFGSQLLRLKFSNLSGEALRSFVEHYVIEALTLNEPRILVRSVDVEKLDRTLTVTVSASVIEGDIDANDVRVQSDATFKFNLPT